jgi:Tfp pilus assembly protein PilN
MIEINLLPQELRLKERRLEFAPVGLLYLAPLLFGILITAHIYLAVSGIIAGYQFRKLSGKWSELEPQRKVVESASKEYAGFTQDVVALQQLLKERVSWAEKLNSLSLNLPAGIWFNEIQLSGKDLVLKGCVFSLTKQELSQINKFLDNLKADKNFIGDLMSLQLGPMQKASIGSYEVTDFSISGKVK